MKFCLSLRVFPADFAISNRTEYPLGRVTSLREAKTDVYRVGRQIRIPFLQDRDCCAASRMAELFPEGLTWTSDPRLNAGQ